MTVVPSATAKLSLPVADSLLLLEEKAVATVDAFLNFSELEIVVAVEMLCASID